VRYIGSMAPFGEPRRFYPARLVAREDAGGGLMRMTVEVAHEIVATYTSPGQYVEVLAEEQTGFFVLANEPGAAAWELVMRAGGGASDVLFAAGTGASLQVTVALGAGFPMADARGHPLIVALGGSGIAAGRAIVGRRVTHGDAKRTQVFVGIRTPSELPTRGDLEAWMREGVEVLVCLSKDDGPIEGIRYARGYVQDVLGARETSLSSSGGRIFAIGMSSMVDALKGLAPALGIAQHHVYTNH
jgi:NAD(P)H-flavin reductase